MAPELAREHAKRMAEAKSQAQKNSALEANFLERFFEPGDKEDLRRYSTTEIVELAHLCFNRFAAPFAGQHRIDIFEPEFKGDADAMTNQISIIELHNVNKPFLVNSIMGELQNAGLEIHLVLHPILTLERDNKGKLVALHNRQEAHTNPHLQRESLIHVHVSRLASKEKRDELYKNLDAILKDVDAVVKDWKPMLLRLEETIAILKITPSPSPT